MCRDALDDDGLVRSMIRHHFQYFLDTEGYQRINLHNLALSLKEAYEIEDIVELLKSAAYALKDDESEKALKVGQWPDALIDAGTSFANDQDYFCVIKASNEEEAQNKEQAIKDWLVKTAEMLDQLNK